MARVLTRWAFADPVRRRVQHGRRSGSSAARQRHRTTPHVGVASSRASRPRDRKCHVPDRRHQRAAKALSTINYADGAIGRTQRDRISSDP
jgi:hypothetical protein